MTNYKLHPWNETFEWSDAVTRTGYLTEDQVNKYNNDGFVVLEKALDVTKLQEIIESMDQLASETDAFLQTLEGDRLSIAESGAILFGIHPCLRSEMVKQFISRQPFTDICHDLIGPDVRLYWDQLVYKQTEKPRRFPWHQDNGYTFIEPQAYLTCWLALTDTDETNGCPCVMSGLHKKGTLSRFKHLHIGYYKNPTYSENCCCIS